MEGGGMGTVEDEEGGAEEGERVAEEGQAWSGGGQMTKQLVAIEEEGAERRRSEFGIDTRGS